MRLFIIILLISCWLGAQAQNSRELSRIRAIQSETSGKKAKPYAAEPGSLAGSLFVVYKVAFSSQDYYSCSFSLSCSEHAHQAIIKQGFFPGLLNSIDRLTRCHGLNYKNYRIDPKTRLLIDPLHDVHYIPL
jgi:putative component of membrane protein insertase Oxa1/YidC/SpoIIIJ protein YidD